MAKPDRSADIKKLLEQLGDPDTKGIEPDALELVEAGLEFVRHRMLDNCVRFLRCCESPAERIFAGAVLKMTMPNLPWEEWKVQKKIGPYRADFVHETMTESDDPIKIVVEIDGHDFHEKTKEQARRDKQRDRYFQKEGYLVMHFTGSEVYWSPERCVKEVLDLAYRVYAKDLDKNHADEIENLIRRHGRAEDVEPKDQG